MITERVFCMWLLLEMSTGQDVFYAYPEQLYQAQSQPAAEPALYLMASQPSQYPNQVAPDNQPHTDYFNIPDQYYQSQNYYNRPADTDQILMPGEFAVCGSNGYNSNCASPSTTTTTPPADCTYSGAGATPRANPEEDHTTRSPSTASTTESPNPANTEPASSDSEHTDTNKKSKRNSSDPSSKIVPDPNTQYFLHEKKRKIKVLPRQDKMFVRKLVNESSKGKVLVPYRHTMSMINHAKDLGSVVVT